MRTILSTFLSLLLAALLFLGWLYVQMQQALTTPMSLNESSQIFEVKSGESLTTITKRLKTLGWFEHPRYLQLESRRRGLDNKIKVGEYTVTKGTTPIGFLNLLVSGDVIQHSITLVEGLTFQEWLSVLANEARLNHTLTNLTEQEIMAKLGFPDEHPEGRFYADSYFYTSDTTDLDILKRAHAAMQSTVSELWEKRDPNTPYKTPYEAMIMASIIEKETAVPAERSEISGVFVRRLQKGMKLQTDPTVIYGVRHGFDGNLTRKHLRSDTPYNTYTRTGLPPTPIAMFSRAALKAALHPKAGKTLFFVARGDGSHQFSETLKQHNKAVRKFQLKR